MFRASFYGNRIFPERVFYRHEATEIADFILQEREGIHAAGKIYAPGNGTCRAWQRMDKDKPGGRCGSFKRGLNHRGRLS